MPKRFFSTSNDLKLALVYGVLVCLLIFGVEFMFVDTSGSGGNAGGDGSAPPGGEEEPTIVKEEITCLTAPGQTSEGGTSSEGFEIDEQYVYTISVTLTWSDDIGNNDRFGIS